MTSHERDDRAGRAPAPEAAPDKSGCDAVLKPPNLPPGPLVYRKMLQWPRTSLPNGSYIGLRSRSGELLARGIINRRSTLAFRILAGRDAPEDLGVLLRERLERALSLRRDVLRLHKRSDAWRLVNGEGDGLSGLTADLYAGVCVASIYSIGYVANADLLERSLLRLEEVKQVVFRADERSQELEGFRLPPLLDPPQVVIQENGIRYNVTAGAGHKSGFFLDQRDNRRLVGRLATGRRVLDLCTNTGGFAINAAVLSKPREVIGVDLDEVVLKQARANARLNRARIDFKHADLFPWLRQSIEAGRRFGLVVLDPAKLARDRETKHEALRAYRDMNALAMRATAPGGLLFTCSCSGAVSEPEFLNVLTQAAQVAGRQARVLEIRGAAPDHPIALDFPEGRYLKAILMQLM